MFLAIYILFCLYLVRESSCSCTLHPLYRLCETVGDVQVHGNKNWDYLVVRNSQNRSLSSLTKRALNNIPNVKVIIFEGAVNYIESNAFQFMRSVETIRFLNNDLPTLGAGLMQGNNVKVLSFENCGIRELTHQSFRPPRSLRSILISKNHINTIQKVVFQNLKIQELGLEENGITFIEQNAFIGMNKLQRLNLRGNRLVSFEATRVFSGVPALLHLVLSQNNLTAVKKEMFQNIPNLQHVDLRSNQIRHVEDNAFIHPRNLHSINLHNNHIEVLQEEAFPVQKLMNLMELDIGRNRITYFSPSVLDRMPSLRNLCIGGNPWMCPCLTHYLTFKDNRGLSCPQDDSIYFSGSSPNCIYPSVDPTVCRYTTYNDDKALIDTYLAGLAQYIGP